MPDFVRSGGVTMGNAVIEVKADSDGNPTECCNPVTGVCLGGGSSPLDTAKVTFEVSGLTPIEFISIALGSVDDMPTERMLSSGFQNQVFTDGDIIDVITYNGHATMLYSSDDYTLSVEGDAELKTVIIEGFEMSYVDVYGDCTISCVAL